MRQIAELKNQIEQSAELSGTIAKTDSGNPQTLMLLLITNNELGQNRNRLAALEERLLVTLENDKLELQNAMEINRRMQSHQANIITRMEYTVKVDEIENRLKKQGKSSKSPKRKRACQNWKRSTSKSWRIFNWRYRGIKPNLKIWSVHRR